MKALYRKYRPLKLSDVVGQEQVTNPLMSALEQGKINHAYLFVGPRGCGKTSVARILAHEINKFPYEVEDNYIDIIEIDGASNRGIDNIRELREKVAIAPTKGKYKVYIIDEVHMLTKEAFNALLKTLEEPPEHAVFIMATTDAYKVPVTITSRSQVYNFKLAEPSIMLAHLTKICAEEGINIAQDALEIIVKRGGGSYRDSLSLLDQISSLADTEITKDIVVRAMGLAPEEKIEKLLSDYLLSDIMLISSDLKDLHAMGIEATTLAEEIIQKILEAPRSELVPLLRSLSEVKDPYAEARLLVAFVADIQTGASTPRQPSDHVATNLIPRASNSNFDLDSFLDKVQSLNDAIYAQLKFANVKNTGGVLDIYPQKKVAKMILSKDNNVKILSEAAGGLRIVIHEVGEDPDLKNDALISKMSDIMGGEVRNDAGGSPF